MSPGQQRKAERVAHLVAAALVAAYVYLPLGDAPANLIRWVALPALVMSGLAMWQAARLRRAFKRLPRRTDYRRSGRIGAATAAGSSRHTSG